MVGRRFGNYRWAIILAAIGLCALVVAWGFSRRHPVVLSSNVNVVRQTYANLYQAAWRQDDGTAPTLVTATLLLPPTVRALGEDTGRSTTEDQMWDTLRDLKSTAVPVLLTFDSVSGAVPDKVVTEGSTLILDGGPNMTLLSWTPLISPSRVVNTAGTVRSQSGIAIFASGQPIDWNGVQATRLVIHGIPDESDRMFTWTEPRLLLQVE